MLKNVKTFLESPNRNQWITVGPYSVYVRQGLHLIPDEGICRCFDIANITNTKKKSTGLFWKLLDELAEFLKDSRITYIYIENVQNPRLLDSLSKRDWSKIESEESDYPSFYLKV